MGFLTAFSRVLLDMTVVTLLILLLPGFPPHTTFSPVQFLPPPAWTGPLRPNEKLNLVDRLFENQLKGPESFATRDGLLYTGLMNGLIARIDPENLSIEPVARIGGEECEEQHEERRCGRPLGMVFTQAGKLLVCDAIFGLYMVDLDRKSEEGRITEHRQLESVGYTALLTPDMEIEGQHHLVYNSIALASDDDTVYLTVSSTRFQLSDGLFEIISDPSGRLVRYSLSTKEVTVLASGINFANGVALDPSEDFLLFCETGLLRVHKHHLKGERAGQTEVLADNLPGMPDNIK
jgi:sugar lactone lactonase YvrE